MIKSLMAKAIQGDTRATRVIYTMLLRPLDASDQDGTDVPLTEDERVVLKTLEDQFLQRAKQREAPQQHPQPIEPKLEHDDV